MGDGIVQSTNQLTLVGSCSDSRSSRAQSPSRHRSTYASSAPAAGSASSESQSLPVTKAGESEREGERRRTLLDELDARPSLSFSIRSFSAAARSSLVIGCSGSTSGANQPEPVRARVCAGTVSPPWDKGQPRRRADVTHPCGTETTGPSLVPCWSCSTRETRAGSDWRSPPPRRAGGPPWRRRRAGASLRSAGSRVLVDPATEPAALCC